VQDVEKEGSLKFESKRQTDNGKPKIRSASVSTSISPDSIKSHSHIETHIERTWNKQRLCYPQQHDRNVVLHPLRLAWCASVCLRCYIEHLTAINSSSRAEHDFPQLLPLKRIFPLTLSKDTLPMLLRLHFPFGYESMTRDLSFKIKIIHTNVLS
jgi:hypothetical protein